nr:major intrinsic protein, aquaporin-like protein [Tanacetum cinerariifolium]
MATTNGAQVVLVDEEGLSSGNKVQPYLAATPRVEPWEVDHGKKEHSLTLGERLGLEDLYSMNVWRASIGELLGTAVLVFMIDTIVISSCTSTSSCCKPRYRTKLFTRRVHAHSYFTRHKWTIGDRNRHKPSVLAGDNMYIYLPIRFCLVSLRPSSSKGF